MAVAQRTLAVIAAVLFAMLAEASVFDGRIGAQMGMGAGCIPGQCLAHCQTTGSGVGSCTPQGCVCGASPGGPHEPCNMIKCDRQCRADSRKPLMNARCAPNGSCRCTYREVCDEAVCRQQCLARQAENARTDSFCESDSCHCRYSRVVLSPH
ncbi:hypothetical protein V5799_017921 [Amblyomma americanum]|uniref:Secreted protein n=1 Tax=Amblyomma americanum TaxID=6943 RepID=A0AAQ4F1S6_AMBAM